jgi:hypothetical protein
VWPGPSSHSPVDRPNRQRNMPRHSTSGEVRLLLSAITHSVARVPAHHSWRAELSLLDPHPVRELSNKAAVLLGSEARLMLRRVPLIPLIPLDRGYPD